MKQASQANTTEILREEELRAILKKFIEFRQAGSHIKPPISEIIECYELCDLIRTEQEYLHDRMMDLEDLCFTELWENRLSEAVDNETENEFLLELMSECARRLGEEPEYQMFKEELLKKLKQQ